MSVPGQEPDDLMTECAILSVTGFNQVGCFIANNDASDVQCIALGLGKNIHYFDKYSSETAQTC